MGIVAAISWESIPLRWMYWGFGLCLPVLAWLIFGRKIRYEWRHLYGLIILTATFALGFSLHRKAEIDYMRQIDGIRHQITYDAVVVCDETYGDNPHRYKVRVLSSEAKELENLRGIVTFPSGTPSLFGAEVFCRLKIKENSEKQYPWEFDRGNWLKNNHLHFEATAFTAVQTANNESFLQRIRHLRRYCLQLLSAHLPPEESALAKALILGEKSELPDELREAYASAGAMHVLAVSGLHVGIVYLILFYLLKPLREYPRRRWIFLLISMSGIWFYATLTGLSPSVSRAALMFSMFSIGQIMVRSANSWNVVFFTAFALLISDTRMLFSPGFQLSFSAVIGILMCYRPMRKWWLPRHRLVAYFYDIVLVSIAATLFTTPLAIYYFGQFPIYFLLTNLFVIPAAFILLSFGLVFLVAAHFEIWTIWVAGFYKTMLWALNQAIYFIHHLPGSTVPVGAALHDVLLGYLLIVAMIGFLRHWHERAWRGPVWISIVWVAIEVMVWIQRSPYPQIHSASPLITECGNEAVVSGEVSQFEKSRMTGWMAGRGLSRPVFLSDTTAFENSWYRQDGRGGYQVGDSAWLRAERFGLQR